MENKEMDKRLNVGIILTATVEKWRQLEILLNDNADIVYVKKAPFPVKLKIKEEFPQRELGEKRNDKFSDIAA